MTAQTDTDQAGDDRADRELKAKHRSMWALGDYPTLASDLISELGVVLADACGVGPGIACSTSRRDRGMPRFRRPWPGRESSPVT